MIDVMENIKKLSAALDAETASLHPSGKLLLLGSQDSVFLKAIKRKADQLGINCDHTSNPLPPYRGIVVDSETVSFNSILLMWILTTLILPECRRSLKQSWIC